MKRLTSSIADGWLDFMWTCQRISFTEGKTLINRDVRGNRRDRNPIIPSLQMLVLKPEFIAV